MEYTVSSDYKISFMLSRDDLALFIDHIGERLEEVEKSSKYQLAKFKLGEDELLVYRSGVVIFEENESLLTAVRQFMEDNGLSTSELEQYKAPPDSEDARGWDDTPKGVWLTDLQVGSLMNRLDGSYDRSKAEKNELARYVNEHQILVINTNGVVYTIGGFDGIGEILRETVVSKNPYGDYHRVIIVDEKGRWDRLGPFVLTIVDVTPSDLIRLQLEGIKDDTKSRGIDHLENIPKIEPLVNYQKLLIEPSHINSHVSNREEYRDWLHRRLATYFSTQDLQLNESTLVIVDEHLERYLPDGPVGSVEVIPMKSRDHPSLGVSSTITNALVQKWSEDWYRVLGFQPGRHNVDKVRDHEQAQELVKLFLL